MIPLIGVVLTEKKRRAADNVALETSQPPQSTSTVNNVDIPINSLPAFANALPRMTGTLSPNEIQITSTRPGPIEHLDLDAIHALWDQINPDLSFPLSDPSPLQPSLAHVNFTHSNSSGPASRTAPSNSTSSNHIRSLSRSEDSHSPPFHRRTSDSDIRPESPGIQLPQSHNDDTVLELITSARSDKGWIGTLHIAAQKGHERIIRVLLLRGNMDVNHQDSDGRTPLIHAIIENHDSVVRLLLSHGARIGVYDREGRSGLHWAVLHRRFGILQHLLDHRAKYERSLDLDAYDNAGWTPLHMSVDRAFEAGVLMLLQGGADVNAKAHKCPYTGNVVPLMDRQR
jgi:ankyrin repeat protein